MKLLQVSHLVEVSQVYVQTVLSPLPSVSLSILCVSSPSVLSIDVSLSSDFIAGFCGETEEEHRDTISLMENVKFDMAYMFAYSMRKVRNRDDML